MQIIQFTLLLYKYIIHIQAISQVSFYNFPGIAFSIGLGLRLKKSVCVYANVFESINWYNTPITKRASRMPHLTFILKDNVIKEDDTLSHIKNLLV